MGVAVPILKLCTTSHYRPAKLLWQHSQMWREPLGFGWSISQKETFCCSLHHPENNANCSLLDKADYLMCLHKRGGNLSFLSTVGYSHDKNTPQTEQWLRLSCTSLLSYLCAAATAFSVVSGSLLYCEWVNTVMIAHSGHLMSETRRWAQPSL